MLLITLFRASIEASYLHDTTTGIGRQLLGLVIPTEDGYVRDVPWVGQDAETGRHIIAH